MGDCEDEIKAGNLEFENGNYINAIRYYKKASQKNDKLGIIWQQKINNGFIHTRKYHEAINAFYSFFAADTEFTDVDFSFIAFKIVNICKINKNINDKIYLDLLSLILRILHKNKPENIIYKSIEHRDLKTKRINPRKISPYMSQSDNKFKFFSAIIENSEIISILLKALEHIYLNEDLTELKIFLSSKNYEKSFDMVQQIKRKYQNVPEPN